MATQHAVTTSDSVPITNCDAVEQLFDDYWLPAEIEYELERTPAAEYAGTFSVWGYAEFRSYPKRDAGDPDHEAGLATQEFLIELSQYISPDHTLDIQSVGYMKCRHPPLAKRYQLTHNTVEMSTLRDGFSVVGEQTPAAD